MTRRVFNLRDYQVPMMEFLGNKLPRKNLWARMGTGKTPVVLTWLEFLYRVWGDTEPTLILGPLRVAEETWTDEAAKWEHLAGLDISVIVGEPDVRRAALKCDHAPIFTTNYENLQWLRGQLGGRWPFTRVIADESTRLKSYRITQGGVRAQVLGAIAHTKVKEWVNLSGAPAPNGLIDLWGQQFFIDKGERLGLSFTGFEDRYFGRRRPKGSEHMVRYPMEWAHDQITEKLRDCSLSAEMPGLSLPVVNNIEVKLPPKVMAQYKELEREMFLKIGEHGFEAFNAASLTMKCLQFASGALYTTDQGGDGPWVEVHQAKLDALESVVEEAAGMPVMVAPHFKSDKARIKTRFPKAVDISTKAGRAAFKAGDAALGYGHPSSMGHGIDGFQDVTNICCFFGHWWDLDPHDQFIERIGPARQKSSGFDRPTMVHNLVAKGTIDELVIARHATKAATQSLLLNVMKERR